jgi:hypothetical protein
MLSFRASNLSLCLGILGGCVGEVEGDSRRPAIPGGSADQGGSASGGGEEEEPAGSLPGEVLPGAKYVDLHIGASCEDYDFDSRSCGGGSSTAYPGIQEAIDSGLSPGDVVRIRGGVYSPSGIRDETSMGTADAPITFEGEPGDPRPIIRRAPPFDSSVYSTWMVVRPDYDQSPRHLVFRYFEIDDNAIDSYLPCMWLLSPNLEVDDVILRGCANNGVQVFSSNLWIHDSQVIACGRIQMAGSADTKGVGFYLAPGAPSTSCPDCYARNNVFENNVVDGCRGAGGVIHYGRADDNIVRNNVFKNFGFYSPHPDPSELTFYRSASGINIGGAGTYQPCCDGPRGNQIYNNVFMNISHTDLGTGHILWSASANRIVNNTYYNIGTVGVFVGCSSTNDGYEIRNNVFADVPGQDNIASVEAACPGSPTFSGAYDHNVYNPDVRATFTDAAAGDFTLLPTATSLIDQGMMLGAPLDRDREGVTRPQGSAYDVGAYEYPR